jgi:hypothetical protein
MFIEVSVSIQETERSYACVLGVLMFIEVSVSIQETERYLSVFWIDTDTSMNINTPNTQAYDLSIWVLI